MTLKKNYTEINLYKSDNTQDKPIDSKEKKYRKRTKIYKRN